MDHLFYLRASASICGSILFFRRTLDELSEFHQLIGENDLKSVFIGGLTEKTVL